MKKQVVTHRSQEERKHQSQEATQKSSRVSQEVEVGTVGKGLYCSFCGKDQAGQGEQSHDWLV